MEKEVPDRQGRAPGLYDEQLHRQKQEERIQKSVPAAAKVPPRK